MQSKSFTLVHFPLLRTVGPFLNLPEYEKNCPAPSLSRRPNGFPGLSLNYETILFLEIFT